MYLLGSLLVTLAKIASMLLTIYEYVLIGAVLVSWLSVDPYNPIVRFLRQATQPVFTRVRKFLPRALLHGRLDFTPLIVLLLIVLLENVLIDSIYHYGQKLKGV